MDLFDLMAKITLDTSEYEEGLDKSEKKGKSFAKSLGGGLKTAAKVGGAALGAATAAVGALGAAVVNGASKWAAYGDNIDKASQKLGFSAKGYQEWDHILQHSGTSIESVQRGIMSLENAAQSGSDAFYELGISQEELASMNSEELWEASIKGLQGIVDGGKRAALAQKLFGRQAKELGPLLNMTAEETEAMKENFNEMGGVMSDDAVKAAAAFQDSLQDMQTALGALGRDLFSTFMPSLSTVMNGLTAIFSGDKGGIGMVSDGINSLVNDIASKLPEFVDLGLGILMSLTNALIDSLPTLFSAASKIIAQLVAGIISAIPKIIEKTPEIISALVQGIKEGWPLIIQAGADLLKMLWDGIKNTAGWLVEKIKGIFDFDWSLPKIKMPHFAISPAGWKFGDLLKGSIPHLSIEWYRKAYDQPYMFDRPTVVGNRGFGDGPGAEMVYGRDALMNDIRQAAGGRNVTLNATININGDITDPREKAQELMYEMKAILDREAAAYGA